MPEADLDDWGTLVAKQMRDPRFRAAYEAARIRHVIIRELVAARVSAGLTVGEVAEQMQVKTKRVRDYERGVTDPYLSFHQRYAQAVGLRLRIEIEPAAHEEDSGAQP